MSQAGVCIGVEDQSRGAGPGPARLNPSPSNPRYCILRLLRGEIERFVADHLRGQEVDTLIDYGCGAMPYRPLLAPHVRRYVGADMAGNQQADALLDGEGHLAMPDGCADVVLSSQVLEHVPDPPAYLNEARRLLGPEGLLALSTHGIWKHHPHPLDLWRWTAQGLTQLIRASGFNLLTSHGLMGLGPTGLLLLQDALLRRLPRRARPLLTWPMQRLIAAADLLHSQPDRDRDACVYFVVARRID